jgi:hypothetical protein
MAIAGSEVFGKLTQRALLQALRRHDLGKMSSGGQPSERASISLCRSLRAASQRYSSRPHPKNYYSIPPFRRA